jgi:hypothetical protein
MPLDNKNSSDESTKIEYSANSLEEKFISAPDRE